MHIKYLIRDGIVERSIHGSYFLIDIKDNYLNDTCSLYELNEIGHIIWQGLLRYDDNQLDSITDEIVKKVSGDVSYKMIYDDVEEYLVTLINMGFLEEYGRNK